jgi:hypothetical protein
LSIHEWERDFSRLKHELVRKGSRILTLDLPALGKHFDKCLDQGLYIPSGLYLGRVPKKGAQVPVFLRDLYLQVFDLEGKLRDTPNPEVIFLLRTLFLSAKKLRLPFTDRSLRNEINNFIRIEQEILRPTLAWDEDSLFGDHSGSGSGLQPGFLFETLDKEASSASSRAEGIATSGETARGGCGASRTGATRAGRKVCLGDLLDPLKSPEFDGNNPYRVTTGGLDLIQRTADIIISQFGDFSIEESDELPKHGPGAVAEGGKHTNKYAFYHWPRKLDAEFPFDWYGHPTLGVSDLSEGEIGITANEPPSRLIAVPKTQKGPRLIAAEPICHQWVQQLIRNQLEGRIQRTPLRNSVSFRDQTLSGVAALRGSVDGSLATIDLSSASDRLSCWLVERVMRVNPPLLRRLHASRTRWLTYKNDRGQSEYIRLNKFAPMGSAVTFPVQSIIYAIIAIGSLLIQDELKPTKRNIDEASRQVRVFGDDIIVPRRAYKYVTRYIEALGLRVNVDKTFGNGNFRESCGVDAWKGDDVTPPYLLATEVCSDISGLGSAVAVRNNFYRKGFWRVAYWLDSSMARWKRFLPDTHALSYTAGRASFLGANDSLCRIRWNDSLHREEVQVLLPHRKSLSGSMAGVYRLFQWFIEDPLPEINWSSGWTKDETVKTRSGWVPRDFITAEAKASPVPL